MSAAINGPNTVEKNILVNLQGKLLYFINAQSSLQTIVQCFNNKFNILLMLHNQTLNNITYNNKNLAKYSRHLQCATWHGSNYTLLAVMTSVTFWH